MNDLPQRVNACIQSAGLLRRAQGVVVAVSGGVDSMVLLHLLHRLAADNQWRLTIAHLNHGLRGRSSDADERLVIRVCAKLQLPVVCERVDVRKLAIAQKLSIEMAARRARHLFLARTAEKLGVPTIAMAHHADDQVELFFLRLFRGTGNDGFAGMKLQSHSPVSRSIRLIRPLLNESKEELVRFAAAERIPFREDRSNASTDHKRNLIRHELLPLLRKKYQPSISGTVARWMDIAAAEGDFVRAAAHEWLEHGHRPAFEKLAVAVQRRVLQLQLHEKGLTTEFGQIEFLRNNPGKAMSAGPDLSFARDKSGRIEVRDVAVTRGSGVDAIVVELAGRAGSFEFGGVKFKWRIVSKKGARLSRQKKFREEFDADKVGDVVIVRKWRAGDRFQPIGMNAAVKLQDLFTNRKIPRARRHGLIVCEAVDRGIFWVEDLRVSERFKLREETVRRLEWRWAAGKKPTVAG